MNLPTGMEGRKRQVGECEVMTEFTLWHQGGVILKLPFRVTLVNRQCDSVFLQMAWCLCSSPQCPASVARILYQFIIEGEALDGQQILLPWMSGFVWIEQADKPFSHCRGKRILHKIHSVFQANGSKHLLYGELTMANSFDQPQNIFIVGSEWNTST